MNSRNKITIKFKKIYTEIERLEAKITKKSGLIFKKHKYTIEELMESPHHQRISSIAQKIGDDVVNWAMANKLSEDEKDQYNKERDIVDSKLNEIHLNIEKREPTWWEKIQEPCIMFYKYIMEALPLELKRVLLPSLVSRFLPFLK